jgi:primosomal protein N' (replication factor Y) (superfamily II helicase)
LDLEVAVPTPVHGTFTYSSSDGVNPGTRVLVRFGPRKMVGVVLGAGDPAVRKKGIAIKPIVSVLDANPVYTKVTIELARWLSTYYMHPLGEVLKTMLPASSSKVKKEKYHLTDDGHAMLSSGTKVGSFLKAMFGKRTELTKITFEKKILKLADKGSWTATDLVADGLVSTSKDTSFNTRNSDESSKDTTSLKIEEALIFTPKQGAAFDLIAGEGIDRLKAGESTKPFLLHGVTGSGKTEVYLQLIAKIMTEQTGGQSLVLVPEISLTPQMTHVFEKRFPNQVAVVHSAMTDTARWTQLDKIRSGECSILIGPRSAVFGPFKDLKLVIVDEEHDNSYKQSTGLTYNGRDVAIVRAALEKATVVLGSATPSMESFHNVKLGRYNLAAITERVTGRALPEVKLIVSKPGSKKGSKLPKASDAPQSIKGDLSAPGSAEIPIDNEIIEALQENHKAGHQAIVLVNRRGYAYYLFSLDQKKAIQCPHCSVSMTLHARSTKLRCHYCDHQTSVAKIVEEFPDETLVAIGYGSEKAEDALRDKLPGVNVSRLDSDAVANRELLPEILGNFRDGKIDVLVGTQILAKGHDFPNVTLIAILEVDQQLNLPDFRAGERTFQLLVQASGRAGRAQHAGKVYIQTAKQDDLVVRDALKHDYMTFAEREWDFRQKLDYPPFSRMIAIEFNSKDQRALSQLVDKIEGWCDQFESVDPELFKSVKVMGPSIPPIETIRGRHRRMIILSSSEREPLRKFGHQFVASFKKLPADIRMKVDVDPQSLI